MEDEAAKLAAEAVKAVGKDIYQDGVRPVLQPTGALAGLVPRAIKAALQPLEQWIMTREYNIEATRLLLEQKLAHVDPETIVTPEPYVAVPALQAISYCMDNDELRNMYANLLANSMQETVKEGVHPAFVEVIKQLCPDEAKILRYVSQKSHVGQQFMRQSFPTLDVEYGKKGETGSISILRSFSVLGIHAMCEAPYEIAKFIDNLERLGLIERGAEGRHLVGASVYEPLIDNSYVAFFKHIPPEYVSAGYEEVKYRKSFIGLTDFGNAFCSVCVN